jgi:hypothetical protein
MPWRQVPMKDAGHCEKPRGAVHRLRSGDVRMGKPAAAEQAAASGREHIAVRRGTRGTETSQYPEEKKEFPQ